jgi:hypothetical protein
LISLLSIDYTINNRLYFPKKQYHQPKTRLEVRELFAIACDHFASFSAFILRNTGMQARMMERKLVCGRGEVYAYGQFHQKSERLWKCWIIHLHS